MLIIMAGALLCLPTVSVRADILQMPTDVAYYDPTRAYNGVTIIGQFNSNNIYMIDMDGRLVKKWTSVGGSVYQARLEDNGNLSFIGTPSPTPAGVNTTTLSGGGANCGLVEEQAFDGTVKWQYIAWDSVSRNHHDYIKIWNKKLQAYTYLLVTDVVQPVSAAQNIGAKTVPANTWYCDAIYEVLPTGPTTGMIVWKWCFIDHTCQNYDNTKSNYVSNVFNTPQKFDTNTVVPTRSGPVNDWEHINSMGYNEQLGYAVVNSREFNEFYVVDHDGTFVDTTGNGTGADWSLNFNAASSSAGDFVYRWGSPANYNAPNFQIGYPPAGPYYSNKPSFDSNGSEQIWGEHCIQYIQPYAYGNYPSTNPGPALPGAGDFLVFDNHGTNQQVFGNFSQIQEINPYVYGWNGNYMTGTSYVWPYNAPYFNASTIGTGALGNNYIHQSRQVVWRYRTKSACMYASHISGTQRLPNGNTLMDAAENNHFVEVTRGAADSSEANDGTSPDVVWEYNYPVPQTGSGFVAYQQNEAGGAGGNTFRCYRYDVGHPFLAGNVQMNADYSVTLKGSTVKGATLSGRVPCRSIPCQYQ
jgi:hypothetical protein